jgi:hypothetical protein
MTEDSNILFVDLMKMFTDKGYSIGASYFILGAMVCRLGQVQNLKVEQVLADMELSFAALPPPLEETDELA